MFIFEGNRDWVEAMLRAAAQRRGDVAEACREVGVRLDGSDSLLRLCEVDDLLARRLPAVEHPLATPAEKVRGMDRRLVHWRSAAVRVVPPRPASKFRRPGTPPAKATLERSTGWVDLRREAAEAASEGRWPRELRLSPTTLEECLTEASLDAEGRARLARRAAAVRDDVLRLQALEQLGRALLVLQDALGERRVLRLALEAPSEALDNLDRLFRKVPEEALGLRPWLQAELLAAQEEPWRLRRRTEKACRLTGRAPPWTREGPASLLEAALWWREKFGIAQAFAREEAVVRDVYDQAVGTWRNLLEQTEASLADAQSAKSAFFPGLEDEAPASQMANNLSPADGWSVLRSSLEPLAANDTWPAHDAWPAQGLPLSELVAAVADRRVSADTLAAAAEVVRTALAHRRATGGARPQRQGGRGKSVRYRAEAMSRPTSLSPQQRRDALAGLGWERLNELTAHLGLDVPHRRAKEGHVQALAEAADFRAVLEQLKRDELKAACEALGLDTGGKEKSALVERLLSGAKAPQEPIAMEVAAAPESTGSSKRKAAKPKAGGDLPFEAELWKAADLLRGNMDAAEYKHVVLGLIFLKYVSDAFDERHRQLLAEVAEGADPEDPDEYRSQNVFWVPREARWKPLQDAAKQPHIGKLLDDAMLAIERDNPGLKGVLPKEYARPTLDKPRLGALVDLVSGIGLGDKESRSKDILGRVYEYFLSEFASAEGKQGGQFYTPKSVVALLVEMLAPYKGRVYDPCCGSGGMFVQSEKFVEAHGGRLGDIAVYGQESNVTTWRLAKMNLAIRGIDADLGLPDTAGSFLKDQHPDLKADFILANPPFNDSAWGGEQLREDVRWKYGVPPAGNANFAWVQHFLHHLAPNGTAGFVLANGSMSSQQSGEGDIRRAIVEADLVDCMVALPGQLFYSTQIPVCLWFLTRDKRNNRFHDRRGETLFIDARKLGRMVDRTQRELTGEDIARVADTYHAWRGGKNAGKYQGVAGFCRAANLEEIASHGFVLTPGRYVGTGDVQSDDEPFVAKFQRMTSTLESQFAEGTRLEAAIRESLRRLFDAR